MIEIECENWAVRADRHRVDAWSTCRPPFEPHSWQLESRDGLRTAMRQLRAVNGWILRAEYEAPDHEFADLENVLLYNVGSGAYGHLTGAGMSLRRRPG